MRLRVSLESVCVPVRVHARVCICVHACVCACVRARGHMVRVCVCLRACVQESTCARVFYSHRRPRPAADRPPEPTDETTAAAAGGVGSVASVPGGSCGAAGRHQHRRRREAAPGRPVGPTGWTGSGRAGPPPPPPRPASPPPTLDAFLDVKNDDPMARPSRLFAACSSARLPHRPAPPPRLGSLAALRPRPPPRPTPTAPPEPTRHGNPPPCPSSAARLSSTLEPFYSREQKDRTARAGPQRHISLFPRRPSRPPPYRARQPGPARAVAEADKL